MSKDMIWSLTLIGGGVVAWLVWFMLRHIEAARIDRFHDAVAAFDELYQDFLRAEISRLKRNKKKHSHLVAELRALEGK